MLKAKLISALLKSNSGKQDLIKSIQDPNTCTRRMSILSVSNGLKILFLEIKNKNVSALAVIQIILSNFSSNVNINKIIKFHKKKID